MADTPKVDKSTVDDSMNKMEQAFDRAIQKSAEVTAITTEKKAALDATKQRPQ